MTLVIAAVLNVTGVNTSTGADLLVETDGFTLQARYSNQQSTLTAYFVNKHWTDSSWYPQINLEISGAAPFFYFVSDGNGNYSLADGFQYGLSDGKVIAPLVIDDNYPTGTYTFTGSVNGSPVTVKLTVIQTTFFFICSNLLGLLIWVNETVAISFRRVGVAMAMNNHIKTMNKILLKSTFPTLLWQYPHYFSQAIAF